MKRCLLACFSLWVAVASLHAQPAPTPGTVTVVGVGQGTAMPAQVEITGTISADEQLVKDAIVKYTDAKRRAMDAIKGLNVPDLTVEELGVALNVPPNPQVMNMMFGGGRPANPEAKATFQIREEFRIVIRNIEKTPPAQVVETVAKIIDTAKDIGLVVAPGMPTNPYEINMMQRGLPTPVSTFRVTDIATARTKAYEAAVADARRKAEKLAELANAKLGPILSIQDNSGAGASSNPEVANMLTMIYGYRAGATAKPNDPVNTLTGSAFDDLAVNASLTVQFALEKK